MTNYEIRKAAREKLGSNIFDRTWLMALAVGLLYSVLVSAASSFGVTLVVTGSLNFGLSCVYLNLVRGKREIDIADCFEGFKSFADTLVLGLLQTLFVFLWSLLFIIPGIVKSYSYAMCFYIMKDHPDYTPKQCIYESIRMMDGHKMQLFLLDLSFIGWIIVSVFTLGLGTLWLNPYMYTARAEFYRSLAD